MIERVQIVGARGRVGSAVSARLRERGVSLDDDEPELVLLCVPDRAIAEVAAEIAARARGSRTSAARRRSRRSTRTCGASACTRCSRSRARAAPSSSTAPGRAVTAETDEARAVGFWLAETLGLRPFALADDDARRLPRRRGDRVELPRDAARGRRLAARGRRRAARGARPAHPRRDRQRLRAHRPDRARRLGDRRAPPRRRSAPSARSSRSCTSRSPRRPRASPDASCRVDTVSRGTAA